MLRSLKLAEKGAGRGMAALIKPGMRAFTIQTPSFSSSLGGFLLSGNRVDINLTTAAGTGGGQPPQILLQDVNVLAVDKNVGQPASNKVNPEEARFVTVEVSPEDALKLQNGQNQGTLGLTLRNPNDKTQTKIDPTPLLGSAPPPVVKAPEAAPLVAPTRVREMQRGGMATIVLSRTLRGTLSGRETLKVKIPEHETLSEFAVATPYGVYRLDDSLVVETDPSAPPPGSDPLRDARLQLSAKTGVTPN